MSNQTGIVGSMPQTKSNPHVDRQYSTFPMSSHFRFTMPFGRIVPHKAMECVAKDKIPFSVHQDLRSFTLSQPLMSTIRKHNDYFSVPKEAILPRNWDKIFTNPLQGDDVPDDAYCGSTQFWPMMRSLLYSLWQRTLNDIGSVASYSDSTEVSNADYNVMLSTAMTNLFSFLSMGEMFCSNGSLLKYLGIQPDSLMRYYNTDNPQSRPSSFDAFEEDVFAWINKYIFSFVFAVPELDADAANPEYVLSDMRVNVSIPIVNNDSLIAQGYSTFGHFLEVWRDYGFGVFTSVVGEYSQNPIYNRVSSAALEELSLMLASLDFAPVDYDLSVPTDYSKAVAYQLVCAHYFSNDAIDFVYSAQLWRENFESILRSVFANNGSGVSARYFAPAFDYNGVKCMYDAVAWHPIFEALSPLPALLIGDSNRVSVDSLIGHLGNTPLSINNIVYVYSREYCFLELFRCLFGFNRSLRFQDYFTSSRTRPYAVGDLNVNVASNEISVIDVTRKIQLQRFLNAVNKTGRKISDYAKGIFGVERKPDHFDPQWLAHTSSVVGSPEVENTGAAQLSNPVSVTSVLRGNSHNYIMEFTPDRECILIGVTYFDIERDYWRGIDRENMHLDRFDMFNPMMQYIGDQDVKNVEVTGFDNALPNDPFGYQMRYAEYKHSVNRCAGGFIDYLPGWTFKADDRGYFVTLSPDYIRSWPDELDDYYVALSGRSMAAYFHFIIDSYCEMNAGRPMAFAPGIL